VSKAEPGSSFYLNARGAAGLTRACVLTGIGLVFWVLPGAAVTNWYDRKGVHRVTPALLDYIDRAVRGYCEQTAPRTNRLQSSTDQPAHDG
jgi:hypothetical protein